MLKAIIIEDEINNLELLERDITRHCPEVKIVETCLSAKGGLWAISQHNPDLVFLDIEMPKMNGFEMLDQLDTINFDIVFTTAHSEYAIQAFEMSAVHYLLKPVRKEELLEAIRRVLKKRNSVAKEQLKMLHANFDRTNPYKKLAISTGKKTNFVPIQDIIYCIADGNNTRIILEKGKSLYTGKNLGKFEKDLNFYDFFRIHHKYLINLNQMLQFNHAEKYVLLKNQEKLPVAQARLSKFQKKIEGLSI